MSGYIQFKLSTGDEIICQVVEDPGEDDVNIVVRNALTVYKVESAEGMRYYTFRPWMTYQIVEGYYQLINFTHIVGEAKPDPLLLEQYSKALKIELQREAEYTQKLEEKYQEILAKLEEQDSDRLSDNIVNLFDKDKLH